MKIGNYLKNNQQAMEKYLYYRQLGYSSETAELLAVLTYGDDSFGRLLEELGPEDTLKKLRAWLSERPEEDPEDAVRNWYYQLTHPVKEDEQEETGSMSVRAFNGMHRAGGPNGVQKVLSNLSGNTIELKLNKMCLCLADDSDDYDAPMMSPSIDSEYDNDLYSCDFLDICEDLEIPFMDDLATDSYDHIEEKKAKNVFYAPTSTFRMTTNTASMGMVMNQIREGRDIDLSQVRIEEILNYFDYQTESATEDSFRLSTELLDKGKSKKILYINAQARNAEKPHQNIVLLLDTSGSMYGNRETTQEGIATVISKLKDGDTFSIVTYGCTDHVVLDGFRVSGKSDMDKLMATVLGIVIDGYTYGSAGIERAYEIGAKHYNPDASNQVVLITDGDLNFGITENSGLEKLIEEKKKSNLFLSVIGTGLWNYKDDKLETLAKHGNGTYCVVNDLFDVNESVNRRFISLTNIVAKDVKAQVEFNPKFVKSYRLLGYENRELNHEDFVNDEVISEPYGSGGHGVALYELEMADGSTMQTDLKYVRPVLNDSDELCTVKLRYKEPLSDASSEIVHPVLMMATPVRNAQLAYLLYCLSEKLRQSDKLDEYDMEYLKVMLTSKLYLNYAAENGEKLEMFVKAAG